MRVYGRKPVALLPVRGFERLDELLGSRRGFDLARQDLTRGHRLAIVLLIGPAIGFDAALFESDRGPETLLSGIDVDRSHLVVPDLLLGGGSSRHGEIRAQLEFVPLGEVLDGVSGIQHEEKLFGFPSDFEAEAHPAALHRRGTGPAVGSLGHDQALARGEAEDEPLFLLPDVSDPLGMLQNGLGDRMLAPALEMADVLGGPVDGILHVPCRPAGRGDGEEGQRGNRYG